MSGTAAPRAREPSPPSDGSDSDRSDSVTSSYSYDSSSRSSSYSSYSSSSSSRSSIHRRRGRRRSRSRSPILKNDGHRHHAQRKFRVEGVLGDCDGTVSFEPSAFLPSVLGDIPRPPPCIPRNRDGVAVLDTPEKPAGDWACGVCSNINSQQRDDCYRCGCHFTESLLATPSYEVCITRLPPGVSVSAVEKALRRTVPEGCVPYIAVDEKKSLVFAQFASVEDATKYLVSRRCELEVTAADGGGGQRTRLSFSLDPHPQPSLEDVAAEAAQAAAAADREKRETVLVAAAVPRFLWPHTWNPPSSFPSVEKHKTFLSTMSAYWDHLADEQKRYYEAEVRKALMQAVSPTEATTLKPSSTPEAAVTAAIHSHNTPSATAASSSTAPSGVTASTAASPPSKDSPQKSTSKTSHALDGLKKRLAERKSALKKADAAGGSAAVAGTPSSTPGSTAASVRAGGGTPKNVSTPGSSGDFPAAPSCALAQMQTWGGFPVPLQYTTPADIPQSVELARVPMSVCERLLPPALLQVARMQFR
ncbi:hypothetical protein ABB37_04572 [Leptomonas pyrrhocoris]|uniref:RanBP2-type domain-containing protein n=1 Tax=Leptomonas pyrrhocoris TaxID=157538 RepID=A0A0M9G1I0_LEPPY|nr:hypothetical protein ABB37_04572 [Leptomonas pyrrhocoris]KPA80277.1 hypothetical protein ABB37_04572 [Leptomonas pyrrhocoris]|eukprot:XP_015658716.1 hypothetical protein ABB37_04572 [Leptomonas pyrrhocoris]